MKNTQDMTKIDFPRRPVAFLVYFLQSLTLWQKTAIAAMLSVTIAITISHTVMMYGFKLLVDEIPVSDPHDVWVTLRWPFFIVAACCVFHLTLYRARDVIDAFSTPYIQNSLRELVVTNVVRHSHDYFHNRFSGELVNKVNNIIGSYRTLLWDRCLNGFLPTVISILSSAVLLSTVDLALSFILLVTVLIIFCSSLFLGRGLGRASANLADREADITGQLVDTFTNISSVKNYANHEHELGLLRGMQRPYVAAYKRLAWWDILLWFLFDVTISSLVVGSIFYLIENWQSGVYTAGGVAVTILIAWDVWYRMAALSWQLTQLSADFGRIQSALNEFVRPLNVEDKSDASVFAPVDGGICFNHVGFHYDSGHRVFDDLNLTIPSSQKVGIVGLSGAGKTTLCQLLLRNYDVQSGAVVIGEKNIADVTQDSLRQNIAVIPQDPSLFHRSLYENILYGNPDASEADVVAAAKAAQAHDFILATPDGYQTMVGERGVKLSGGQRQRIAIARAILKDAPLLILDEATSALDSDTERLIQFALDKAMEGRTTIVVAHRLSTLAHLDRIIVMKDGQIIEDGTLQDLITANGHFAYLWKLQAGGFLPEKL